MKSLRYDKIEGVKKVRGEKTKHCIVMSQAWYKEGRGIIEEITKEDSNLFKTATFYKISQELLIILSPTIAAKKVGTLLSII